MNRYSTQSRRRSAQPPAPPPVTISLLVPIQRPLACPHEDCKGLAGGPGRGPWKDANSHNNLRVHYVKHHAQAGTGVKLRFVCSACKHHFDRIQPANKHYNQEHGGPSAASLPSSVRMKYSSSRLDNRTLVVQHPPGPSRCPFVDCDWASRATDKNVAVSIGKHLFVKHSIAVADRMWSCRDCDEVEPGHEIRYHKMKRCKVATDATGFTPREVASLPVASIDAVRRRTMCDQLVPVLIWTGEDHVQLSFDDPTAPARDDFASFCDSDDCTPQSPIDNASFSPSLASSPTDLPTQVEATRVSSARPGPRSCNLVLLGTAGLVKADLFDSVADRGLSSCSLAASGPAGLIKADLTFSGSVNSCGDLCGDSPATSPEETALSAAAADTTPSRVDHTPVPASKSRVGPATSALVALQLETDSLLVETSPFIPRDRGEAPPPSDLSSPETCKSGHFISNESYRGSVDTEFSADIDEAIAGALHISMVQGIATVTPLSENPSGRHDPADIAPLLHHEAQQSGSAPAHPPAVSQKTIACLVKHGIGPPNRAAVDAPPVAPVMDALDLAEPDFDARWDGSPGWSPRFIIHADGIDRRPWTNELGLLPMNSSIWSMGSSFSAARVPNEPCFLLHEVASQHLHLIGPPHPDEQPMAAQPLVHDVASQSSCLTGPSHPNEQPMAAQPANMTSDHSASLSSDDSGDLADFESLASDVPLAISYSNAKQKYFCEVWVSAFQNCSTINDLESTVNRCMSDWRVKTAKKLEQIPESEDRPTRSGTKRSRHRPDRQLQRLRQRAKRGSDEARRIQTMFRIYPKRAVRRALGESSPCYSGSADSARVFLSDTYERHPPVDFECTAARAHFDACHWSSPDDEVSLQLGSPPTREEIATKLAKATNTTPGNDGVEYRHLRAMDPRGLVLEAMYDAVWRIGIPPCWKKSKTVPIFKKGSTDDFSNFRPISLLPTAYKIFSCIINDRICGAAVASGWLSHEQKGFLPGVNGVAEHTQLLQVAIEHSKDKKQTLVVAWLDLRNAFGSIPHLYLQQLFQSLPIPAKLRTVLIDIYADNVLSFSAGDETIEVRPTAGVRQGDALSTTVFNLAAEPIIRAAKSNVNSGYNCFHQTLKVTAFADDIAVVADNTPAMQKALDRVCLVAGQLGLKFNAEKCACLLHCKGRNLPTVLLVDGQPIRNLAKEDKEIYLGIPLGSKLRFRTTKDFTPRMDKLAESKLAPWQKLEVLRSHLMPSLSHDLASGRALKADLAKLDIKCRAFMANVCGVPVTAAKAFYYAERSTGGLGMSRLVDDADVWTMARATQLLTTKDPVLRELCWGQLQDTISRGFGNEPSPSYPYSEFLSGDTNDSGLYRLRFQGKYANLWTLTRRAAMRRKTQIEVSGDKSIRLISDVISVDPRKAVRGLRLAIRNRWTKVFIDLRHQGQVAGRLGRCAPKDVVRITSARTTLKHDDWQLVHRVRLDALPLVGYSWVKQRTSNRCRACGADRENSQHLLNHCKAYMQLSRERHNSIVQLLQDLLVKNGKCDDVVVEQRVPGFSLRPDIQATVAGSKILIDVTVAFDTEAKMDAAHDAKVAKYGSHGRVFPVVLGSLGSWSEKNEDLRQFLGIESRRWAKFRLSARTAAIAGSMSIIRSHLILTRWELADIVLPHTDERPECDPSVADVWYTNIPYYDPFEDVLSLADDEDQSARENFARDADEDFQHAPSYESRATNQSAAPVPATTAGDQSEDTRR